ncbi:MAG: DUF2892 domain-containing protein [Pedobacter sp.]|nr:MAG: DUF2892 domain-containing protein [Pedobacter sp.]
MEHFHHHLKLRSGEFSIEKHKHQNMGLSERLTSVFLGGMILSRCVTRPFKTPFMLGAYLTYRGVTGNCLVYERMGIDARHTKAINVRGEFVIDRPAAEVYAFWRNLENLPGSLKHLLDVKVIDGNLSHWKSNVISKLFSLEWNAEIVKDEPGRLIGWSSSPNAIIDHVGRVTFKETPDGAGTILKIVFSYHPPAGGLGMGIARLINPYLEGLLEKEINTFKHTIEHSI